MQKEGRLIQVHVQLDTGPTFWETLQSWSKVGGKKLYREESGLIQKGVEPGNFEISDKALTTVYTTFENILLTENI